MSWEIRECPYDEVDWEVHQPTIATNYLGKHALVMLPKDFLEEFKGAPKELVVGGSDPCRLNKCTSWGNSISYAEGDQAKQWKGWVMNPSGDQDDEDMRKLAHKQLQAALDWLLEKECNIGSESTITEQTTKGEEHMSNEAKEIKAPEITWEGRNITLPAQPKHMAPREAAKVLLDKAKEEEQAIAIMEEIADCFPWDAAVQFSRAMGQLHGWGRAVGKQTFFGERPPVAIGVQTGPDTHEEVIWGPFRIPGMDEGELECGTSEKDGRVVFCIRGTVKKKDLPLVRALADLTRKLARSSSIYKGKAIQLIITEEGGVNWMEQPRFLNSKVSMSDLIYDETTMDQIGTHLVAPIVKRDMLAKIGRPFGGAVLVSGPYGVGKTVLAAALSDVCVKSEVTFIDLRSLKAVRETLIAARPLGPCVVFVEDIDRISKDAERNEATQDVMNTIASVGSKGAEVMAVFTTNKPGAIAPGLVQRFNGLISIEAPKPPEVEKLIRLYARDLVDEGEDLMEAAQYLDGSVPRTIEQLVQASKQYAVHRNNVNDVKDIRIIGRDIIGAAKHKQVQLDLERRQEDRVLTPPEKMGASMEELINAAISARFTPDVMKGLAWLARKAQ